jgi:hypothetical protein
LAIRHGRFFVHKAGYVVDVAPNEVLINDALKEKPVLIVSKLSVV